MGVWGLLLRENISTLNMLLWHLGKTTIWNSRYTFQYGMRLRDPLRISLDGDLGEILFRRYDIIHVTPWQGLKRHKGPTTWSCTPRWSSAGDTSSVISIYLLILLPSSKMICSITHSQRHCCHTALSWDRRSFQTCCSPLRPAVHKLVSLGRTRSRLSIRTWCPSLLLEQVLRFINSESGCFW